MATRTRRGLTRRALLQAAGTGVAGAAIGTLGGPWARRASAQGARTITIALTVDAVTLDPFNTNDNLSLTIERCVFDGLVGFTPDYKLRPELATSWEASKDAKTFTFHLRPNVKFHDGTPLNAAAVKLNFDRARDPANKLTRLSLVNMIASIDAVDDTTVRFNLSAPFGAMLYNFAHPSSRMISPAAIAKGADYVARNPIGSGPFRFVSWTPGQQVLLERNPNFWQSGVPQADRLIIKPVPEDATRVAMLLGGDAHFIYPVPAVQIDAVKKAQGVSLQARWSIYANWVAMNCQHEPFKNVKVRQALNYGVDKQAIVKVVDNGYSRPLDAPNTPGVAGYSPVQPGGWPYDVAKAKSLLNEAGFPRGFEATLWTGNATGALRLGEALQQMLAKIGVNLHLTPMEAGTLNAVRTKPVADNQSQMNLAGWSPSTGDADWSLRPLLAKTSWMPNLFNLAFYENPQVDALLAAALATADQAQRDKIYAQATKIIWNDAPWIFLTNAQNLAGVRNGVSGVWIMADNTCDFREAAIT